MALGSMAWIDPNGKLLDFGTTHINAIISNPLKFGISRKQIEAEYAKHNERMGVEGKARETIVKDVVRKGFIRIRFQRNYVSATVYDFGRKAKTVLKKWAELVSNDRSVDKYQPVKVYSVNDNKMHEFTIQDLMKGDHLFESEDEIELEVLDRVDEFGYNTLSFKQYRMR